MERITVCRPSVCRPLDADVTHVRRLPVASILLLIEATEAEFLWTNDTGKDNRITVREGAVLFLPANASGRLYTSSEDTSDIIIYRVHVNLANLE